VKSGFNGLYLKKKKKTKQENCEIIFQKYKKGDYYEQN